LRFSRCAGVGSFLTPIDSALLEIDEFLEREMRAELHGRPS
jgi:hypothetical protein